MRDRVGDAVKRLWWRLTTVDKIALILLGVAAGAIATWLRTSTGEAWMPEVGVSAFFVALTISVIDRAVKRETQRGLEPLRTQAMSEMVAEWQSLTRCLTDDYLETHSGSTSLPNNLLDRLDLMSIVGEGAAPHRLASDGLPVVLRAAMGFSTALEDLRLRFGTALDVGLLYEMAGFTRSVDQVRRVFTDSADAQWQEIVLQQMVRAALSFGRRLRDVVPDERVLNLDVSPAEGPHVQFYGRVLDGWEGRPI